MSEQVPDFIKARVSDEMFDMVSRVDKVIEKRNSTYHGIKMYLNPQKRSMSYIHMNALGIDISSHGMVFVASLQANYSGNKRTYKSFANSCKRLRIESKAISENKESLIDRIFTSIISASDYTEWEYHIIRMVEFLAKEEIDIDYCELIADYYDWKQKNVSEKWAMEYWKFEKKDKDKGEENVSE